MTEPRGRAKLKPGDRICLHASKGVGVVADCVVASAPEKKVIQFAKGAEDFPWAFGVIDVRVYFDMPVVLDAALPSRLDTFEDRDPAAGWSWLVQGTRYVTAHDFGVLTRRG